MRHALPGKHDHVISIRPIHRDVPVAVLGVSPLIEKSIECKSRLVNGAMIQEEKHDQKTREQNNDAQCRQGKASAEPEFA